MRFSVFVTVVLIMCCSCASVIDDDGQVAGSVTNSEQSLVSAVPAAESSSLVKDATVLESGEDPNQIVCREELVGRASGLASRLSTRRCKTRAEFLSEDKRNGMIANEAVDNNRRQHIRRPRNSGPRSRPVPTGK